MSAKERAPTQDELLAMAYADGELDDAARAGFEARLADDPGLRRELAELRELAVLTRQIAPPEPADHEWDRLSSEWLHQGGTQAGLGLLLIGAVGLAGALIWGLLSSDLPTIVKVSGSAIAVGLALLFTTALRARLRTLPLDPYTKVKR